MGVLLKGLLFFFVFVWIIRSVLRFFLGGLFGPAQQRSFHQQRQQTEQRSRTGGIHVNQPPKQSRKDKTSDDFKGGDYIEYEEVD